MNGEGDSTSFTRVARSGKTNLWRAAAKYGYHGLSASAIIFMFANFAPKGWVESISRKTSDHEHRISYIEGLLSVHSTARIPRTNQTERVTQ